MEFYSRGGDVDNPELAKRIKELDFDEDEIDAIVDFLENGLLDTRVECASEPFDHPSLTPPNGPFAPAVGRDGNGSCP